MQRSAYCEYLECRQAQNVTTSQCKERIPLAGKGERGEPRKVGIRMKCECRIFAYVVESKICCKKDYCKVNGVQDEEAEVAFLILMWGVFFSLIKLYLHMEAKFSL